VVPQVQGDVLAGEDDERSKPTGRERVGDRCKFDRFGAGANDQPDC
jgi:hypothetical protein